MEYNQLGKSELFVSEIAFGCMSLKGSEHHDINLLQHAAEMGVNFFDTADIYDNGRNEEIVGKAFANKRQEVLIATKVGNQLKSDGSGLSWNPGKSYILQAVEKSLKRLGTDYIDLYQLHGGTIDDPIDETIEAFEQLKKQGKIRCYGISSIRPNVIREYVQRSRIDSVMMQYSILDRRPEEFAFELLKDKGIGVITRGSLAQGMLAGKEPKEYLGYSKAETTSSASLVKKISNPLRNEAQTALRFVLAHPPVCSAVAGIRTIQQLEEAVNTSVSPSLTSNELEQLRMLLAPNTYKEHR